MSLEQGSLNDIKITNAFKSKVSTKLSDITKYNKNMVLSAIPLDQSKVVIQQSSVGSRLTAITNSQHQLQHQQQLAGGNILTNITQVHRRSPPKIITAIPQNHQVNMSTSHNITPASVIHPHIQSQNHHLSQSSANHQYSISKIVGNNSSQQSPSKYVFFQQNGNVHYASNEAFITTNSSQSNGVGNIVIVATEPMDLNNPDNLTGPIIHTTNGPIIHTRSNLTSNGDEDLTSLTWLQDKNLIKEIVTCNNNSNKNTQVVQSPNRITNRTISPSIEFIEESNIHGESTIETNLESSKSQQLNTNNNNECSFKKIVTSQSVNKLIPQHQQLTFTSNTRQVQVGQQNHVVSSQSAVNNNNNRFNKNHILTSVSPSFGSTSPSSINEQINNNISNLGPTTTVHVGPSGTTTVVEYKTKQNYVPINSRQYSREIPSSTISNSNQNTIVSVKNHSVPTNTFTQNNVILSSNIQSNSLQTGLESSNNQNNQSTCKASSNQQQSTSSSITTHHPHKKYLREQMNGLEQNKTNSNNLNSLNNNTVINNTESNCNTSNNDIDSSNSNVHQFSTLCSPGPINYSGNGRTPTPSKINTNINVLHSEFATPYRSELTNNTANPGNIVKSSSAQVIYKEYDVDTTKELNKKQNIVPLPTINKNPINSTKEQYINSSPPASTSPSKQKHPNNVPYDPKAHANAKPPYSFSSLIFMAIEDSTEKALPVKEIYAWIVQHFPYFKTAPTGWKNSVRHNLSLNKSFLKVEKAPNMGKGSLWRVEQHQRPNLIQALTRSPFYPCPAVDKLSPQKSPNITKISNSGDSYSLTGLESPPITPVKSNLDARLFPKLSKLMKEMGNVRTDTNSPFPETTVEIDSLEQSECQSDLSSYSHNVSSNNSSVDEFFPQNGISTPKDDNVEKLARDCAADSIDDVNAATAMLALKHGSKVFNDNFNNGTPVITNSPSADHTYSAGNGSSPSNISAGNCTNTNGFEVANTNGSDNISTCASSDAAYESSDESHNLTPDELEHQRRVEGVDALLSLSSICSQSTSSSPNTPVLKRPATEYIEERVSYMENIPHINGKGALGVSGSSLDEGYNTQGYYSQISSLSGTTSIPTMTINLSTTLSSPSLPKKLKSSRLRAKIKQIKRKTSSLR